MPARYLVIGDAICSFNPIYGQGMSVAAIEALALRESLGAPQRLEALAPRFFPKAAAVVDGPWSVAAGGDLAFEGVTGRRPVGTALANWYLGHVHRAASTESCGVSCLLPGSEPPGTAHDSLQPEADGQGGHERMAASRNAGSVHSSINNGRTGRATRRVNTMR